MAIRIMTPKPPSSEDGIAMALDRWCQQLEEVEKHGASHKLSDIYKIAAVDK